MSQRDELMHLTLRSAHHLRSALEPWLRFRMPAPTQQAKPHLVKARAETLVVDATVQVPLLHLLDRALEPRLRLCKSALRRQAKPHVVEARAEGLVVDSAVHVSLLRLLEC